MDRIRAGSVIRTSNDMLWYCCGDWQLKNSLGAVPCLLAYVPRRSISTDIEVKKTIHVGNIEYVKVWGFYGQSLESQQEHFFSGMHDIISDISFGKMVFVRRESILEVKDPKLFVSYFCKNLSDALPILRRLVEALDIPFQSFGISGSALATGDASWRHEIDFFIYGRKYAIKAFRNIAVNRRNGIFSLESIPPFNMPFRLQGKWFDPHFSISNREQHFLDGAVINFDCYIDSMKIEIANDEEGIFIPPIYLTKNGMKIVSFRSSHRGLFTKGQTVEVDGFTRAQLELRNRSSETIYLMSREEWAQVTP